MTDQDNPKMIVIAFCSCEHFCCTDRDLHWTDHYFFHSYLYPCCPTNII